MELEEHHGVLGTPWRWRKILALKEYISVGGTP